MHKPGSYYPLRYDLKNWLPTTAKEVKLRGWDQLDVILFSGDAYVDHPAFGAAVIGRALEQIGLKVAIVPQPNWQDDLRDFKKLGKPRLFFGITAGNMDSMINHYTAAKRLRSTDAYSPGNQSGFRPDRALSVYAKILRDIYPDSLIIAGGIEASLRRLTHYDYWSDKLRPSILDSGNIDILVYGMGESTIRNLALKIISNCQLEELHASRQIAYVSDSQTDLPENIKKNCTFLASHEKCVSSKKSFAQNFAVIENASNIMHPGVLIQAIGSKLIIVNPPEDLKTEKDLDTIYDLPFTRLPHPKYWNKPLIPAYEMIRFSISMHRGCFGGCAFCTISAHQGKFIESRSETSILKETRQIADMPGFAGYLSDLGGPSANMYKMAGKNLSICERCTRPSCIHPGICYNLDNSHQALLDIYQKVRSVEGIKKAFIGSGVRYDLFMNTKNSNDKSLEKYPEELIRYHVSGRLKVAPEHTHDKVLKIMRKPSFSKFVKFKEQFARINNKFGLKQQLIPYFISAHPGCNLQDMAELAAETKDLNFRLQQVQDFTPTPMTLATVMFYTGLDPYTLKPVTVVTDMVKKKQLSKFFFWYKKEEQKEIRTLLKKENRQDLIKKLFGRPIE